MSKPTKADAELIVNICRILFQSENIWNAAIWWLNEPGLNYEEFKEKYPRGSEGYNKFMAIGSFFEMLGVLVYNELVSEDLVFDLFELVWEKSEPIVKGMQKELGRRLFENYEWLAKRKREWLKTHPPKFPEEE